MTLNFSFNSSNRASSKESGIWLSHLLPISFAFSLNQSEISFELGRRPPSLTVVSQTQGTMDVAVGSVDFAFVKTMKKSYLKVVTIPATFVRKHGDKFGGKCRLGYGKRKPSCKVTVQAHFIKTHPHVSFAGGWKAFATSNSIEVGDRLKFELVERGGFTVERITAVGQEVIDLSSDDE